MTHDPEDRTILHVEAVRKEFDGLVAVDDVSTTVQEGSIVGLIGPNGAGKTTLFNVVSGFLRPSRGHIRFRGGAIHGLRPDQVAAQGLVRTFQTARVFTKMSVMDNVMLAAPGHPGERFGAKYWARRRVREREDVARKRATELLELVRLDHMAGDYAGTLSGGQRKLLELARVLMSEPRMVLLDEPMAGINRSLGQELLSVLQAARDAHALTFLIIEHDIEVVMSTCEWVMVMDHGQLIARGTPAEVQQDERVVKAYLGSGSSRPRQRRGADGQG